LRQVMDKLMLQRIHLFLQLPLNMLSHALGDYKPLR
jgi:hypothetical protein